MNCKVEMNVKSPDKVTISEFGDFQGNITTKTAVISGKFTGDLIATEKVILLSGAEVNGKITTKLLQVSEGVVGNMDLKMSKTYNFTQLGEGTFIADKEDDPRQLPSHMDLSSKNNVNSVRKNESTYSTDNETESKHTQNRIDSNPANTTNDSKFW